jgi:hypothetical protein
MLHISLCYTHKSARKGTSIIIDLRDQVGQRGTRVARSARKTKKK